MHLEISAPFAELSFQEDLGQIQYSHKKCRDLSMGSLYWMSDVLRTALCF